MRFTLSLDFDLPGGPSAWWPEDETLDRRRWVAELRSSERYLGTGEGLRILVRSPQAREIFRVLPRESSIGEMQATFWSWRAFSVAIDRWIDRELAEQTRRTVRTTDRGWTCDRIEFFRELRQAVYARRFWIWRLRTPVVLTVSPGLKPSETAS